MALTVDDEVDNIYVRSVDDLAEPELEKLIAKVAKQMNKAAAELNFEAAAELRDQMRNLKKYLDD